MWWCQCDCGTPERVVPGMTLRKDRTHSCGCLKTEQTVARSTKHGHSNSRETSPTYYSWAGMIQRCTNDKHKDYKRYGGRGIKVCRRWLESFAAFLEDMRVKPAHHTIERKDNDGDYEPDNCRWANRIAQSNNKGNNRVIQFDGERETLAQRARKIGISPASLSDRLKTQPLSKALTAKPNPHHVLVTIDGRTQRVGQWRSELGIGASTVHYRTSHGMSLEEALTRPRDPNARRR